jgi:hypothetical protein
METSKIMLDLLTELTGSDVFISIPMQLVERSEDSPTSQIEASVLLRECLNMEENDPTLKAFYLAALGAMIGACLERYNAMEVLDYIKSMADFLLSNNETKH